MRRTIATALSALVALTASSCGSDHEGTKETDRIASVVSTAISYPRQDSGEAYARAALATRAGQDGRLRVIGIDEAEPSDEGGSTPVARLVYLVHLDGSGDGLGSSPPVDACYDAEFDHDGVVGTPARRDCPSNPVAITPTPIAPTPKAVVAGGTDKSVERTLRALPSSPPSAAAIERAVRAALPEPAAVDGLPSARDLPPTVAARTNGRDVGVAVWAAPDRTCVFGARIGGVVEVWRPSAIQLAPGELTCDPATALGRGGITPPH